jgi:hypothetical protein
VKRLACILSACLLAASAFALDFGVGVSGGSLSSKQSTDMKVLITRTTEDKTTKFNELDFGLVLTSDYIQFSTGYLTRKNDGWSSTSTTAIGSTSTPGSDSDVATQESYAYIPLEILLRYPVFFGKLKIIPMGGLEYDFCVGATASDGSTIQSSSITDRQGAAVGFSYYNRLLAKLGLGLDIPVTKKIALRPQFLCGFGIYSPQEKDYSSYYVANGYTAYKYFDFDISGGLVLAYRL